MISIAGVFLLVIILILILFFSYRPPPTTTYRPPPTTTYRPPPTTTYSPPPTTTYMPTTPPPSGNNRILQGQDILSFFEIYQNSDPTHGCVNYKAYASIPNPLCYVNQDNHVFLETAGANGNIVTFDPATDNVPSIRIYSHDTFNGGLFSFELFHVPAGNGVWPAIWFSQDGSQMLPDGSMGQWPNNGEFDLLEQVNNATQNQSTIHIGPYTQSGMCVQSGDQWLCPGDPTGICGTDCAYTCNPTFTPDLPAWGVPTCATNVSNNSGCMLLGPDNSFGAAFNSTFPSGAVLTLYWDRTTDTNFILTCYLITDPSVMNDPVHGPFSQAPDVTQWQGFKYATFDSSDSTTSNCPFRNAQIIINITLCGDWAGNAYPGGMTACESFVKTTGNLKDAYFEFGRIALMNDG